jgi:hypothetical protein
MNAALVLAYDNRVNDDGSITVVHMVGKGYERESW